MSGELPVRHVTKFDGKNFLAWKFQIRAVLIAHDLLNIVDGTRVKPAADEAECLKAWTKDNAKAMYVISSALEPEQLNYLLLYTSAPRRCGTNSLRYTSARLKPTSCS